MTAMQERDAAAEPRRCSCGRRAHDGDCFRGEPLSLLEQVDMEVAMLLAPPAWWGDDPFAGVPNAHDEWNEPL